MQHHVTFTLKWQLQNRVDGTVSCNTVNGVTCSALCSFSERAGSQHYIHVYITVVLHSGRGGSHKSQFLHNVASILLRLMQSVYHVLHNFYITTISLAALRVTRGCIQKTSQTQYLINLLTPSKYQGGFKGAICNNYSWKHYKYNIIKEQIVKKEEFWRYIKDVYALCCRLAASPDPFPFKIPLSAPSLDLWLHG